MSVKNEEFGAPSQEEIRILNRKEIRDAKNSRRAGESCGNLDTQDYVVKVNDVPRFNKWNEPVIEVTETEKFNDDVISFLGKRADSKTG